MKKWIITLCISAFFSCSQAWNKADDHSSSATDIQDGWEQKYSTAHKKLVRCNELNNNELCKSTIFYELGYLFENAKDSSNLNLDSAVYYYRSALRIFPGDRTLRERLVAVYARQQQYENAVNLLQQLYNEFPSGRAGYARRMSQALFSSGQYAKSFEMGKRSIVLDPYQDVGWRNMVKVLKQHTISFDELERLCYEALDHGFVNQSLEMLEGNMTQNYGGSNYDKVLVHWANILLDTHGDHEQRLKRLPGYGEWIHPGIIQLNALFESKYNEEFQLSDLKSLQYWYNRDGIRGIHGEIFHYEIILKYLNSQAKNVVSYDREKALKLYEMGMGMIEDLHIGSYQFRAPYFEFISSMADILLLYPDLDPDNQKTDRLLGNLFQEKGGAYRENDREMIKRFHITLGMIYAKRNIWSGGYATNAYFQITRALRNKGENESIPLLHELLGNGLLNYRNDPEGAFNNYLLAVEQYLNQDAMPNAGRLLDTLLEYRARLGISQRDKLKQLTILHEIREESRNIGKNNYQEIDGLAKAIVQLDLSETTKNIQRFKLYATVGQSLDNDDKARDYCYLKALKLSESLNSVPTYTDLLRIDKMASTMQSKINSDGGFTRFSQYRSYDNTQQVERNRKQVVYDAIDGDPVLLSIDPVLYRVSELVELYETEDEDQPRLSYYNEQLILKEPEENNKKEVEDYFNRYQRDTQPAGYQLKVRSIE